MAPPERLRLFFAVFPDAPARAALSRVAQEVARDGQGRAPRDANLHLTLAFIGEVPQARVGELLRAGHDAALDTPWFSIMFDRIGGGSYRIAWITPPVVSEPLHALHAKLAEALATAGFQLQQQMFRPHITLARDCVRSAHHGRIAPIRWNVERLSLVASTLARGGAEYREVDGWSLGT